MNGSDQLYSGWKSADSQVRNEQILMQFNRPDFINISYQPKVADGARVVSGDTVAIIFSDELASQYNILQAELREAQAQYQSLLAGSKPEEIDIARKNVDLAEIAVETTRQDYERAKSLQESNLISLAEYQLSESNHKLAKANRELSLSQLQALKTGAKPEDLQVVMKTIDRIRVTSNNLQNRMEKRLFIITPIDGVVEFDTTEGSILNVEYTDTMAVLISFSEGISDFVYTGQEVQFKLPSLRNIVIYGQISCIEFLKGDLSGIVVTALIENNQGKLKNGMSGRASVMVENLPLFSGIVDRIKFTP
jgi:hypothetical protein